MDKAKLEVTNLFKMAEEDIFGEGCQPNTAQDSTINIHFVANNLQELINQICVSIGLYGDDPETYNLNAGGEDGRIDFQVQEKFNGVLPHAGEIEKWKKGEFRLWQCIYTAQVEYVTRRTLKL